MEVATKAMLPAAVEYTDEQIGLMKRTICNGATNDELLLFIQQCQRTRLDPFTKQIYFIKDKNNKVNVMASIDGLRLIADRSGLYAGQTRPEWCGKDGNWADVWLQDEPPAAARVGVYKTGFVEPLYATARYRSYAPPQASQWSTWGKMPELMLAKVAESLALRKAFPNEMSGIYTAEEFSKESPKTEDVVEVAVSEAPKLPKSSTTMTGTSAQKKSDVGGKTDLIGLFEDAIAAGKTEEEIDAYLRQEFGVTQENFHMTPKQLEQAYGGLVGTKK